MTKLFSMESSSDDTPELLIDKVIQRADKDKEGLRVTADLIKQRQRLKLDIDKELKKDPEPKEDEEVEEVEENDDEENDDKKEEDSVESEDDKEKDDKEEEEQDSEVTEKDEEQDPTEAAQDADKLDSMIGSGLNKKQDKKEQPDDKNKQTSQESFSVKTLLPVKLFQGLKVKQMAHSLAMEEYNLSPKSNDPKAQPVAYVKDEVVMSLKKMIDLSNRYVSKNKHLAKTCGAGILKLSESLTVYEQCHKADKLHLNLKVINDTDSIKSLLSPGSGDLKEGASVFIRYLDNSATLVAKLLENDITTIGASLTSCGYSKQDDVYAYGKTLPGFNDVRVSCVDYQDYLKTKYEDFQAYRIKSFKVQELYDVEGISIDKDSDLVSILEKLGKIVMSVGLMIDNINDLSSLYTDLIDKVKSTCYDVEEGKVEKLSQLDIDSRLKDFIRFKLASEVFSNSIEMAIEYITAFISVFSGLIELDN